MIRLRRPTGAESIDYHLHDCALVAEPPVHLDGRPAKLVMTPDGIDVWIEDADGTFAAHLHAGEVVDGHEETYAFSTVLLEWQKLPDPASWTGIVYLSVASLIREFGFRHVL